MSGQLFIEQRLGNFVRGSFKLPHAAERGIFRARFAVMRYKIEMARFCATAAT